jgi:hypothetical protein
LTHPEHPAVGERHVDLDRVRLPARRERLDADALWHVPTYERLVGPWNVPAEDATAAITWLMDQVIATITNDQPQMPSA